MLPRWTVPIAWVTLFLLVYPSDSFAFLFGSEVDDSVEEADGYEIVHPLNNWLIGGATSIVYNALTFNFLGLKEKIRKIYEVVTSYAIFEFLGLVSTIIVNTIAAVAAAVADILTVIVSNIIEKGYRKKLAFAEFLFRVATGRSFEGLVGLARVLREIDSL